MPYKIIENDITHMHTDAIVNAANNELQTGGGVCGAIFEAAGATSLQKACDEIGHCDTGKAVITDGFNLYADYIIHTVGPVWEGGDKDEAKLLYSCYIESLTLAREKEIESIAFPLISSGIYGYPKEEALKIAEEAIGVFLQDNEMMVNMVLFDRADYQYDAEKYKAIKKYVDESKRLFNEEDAATHRERFANRSIPLEEEKTSIGNPIKKVTSLFGKLFDRKPESFEAESELEEGDFFEDEDYVTEAKAFHDKAVVDRSLEDVVEMKGETFSWMLLRLIDEKGFTDVETYKRANIDRKLFSKIKSDKEYRPSKLTALALAVALELNVDETKDLLIAAGYSLSKSFTLDIIIEYFIEQETYNIFEINEALFAFNQPLLGSS